jgi:hypothetical protein
MRAAVTLPVCALGGPTLARDGPWQFALSPYLWTPSVSSAVETRSGTLDADQRIGNVLSATDLALMGAFEARRGRWGLIADLLDSDLTKRSDAPLGGLFSRARVQTELTTLNGYAAYRVHEDERVGTRRDGRLPGGLARPRRDALATRAPGPELRGQLGPDRSAGRRSSPLRAGRSLVRDGAGRYRRVRRGVPTRHGKSSGRSATSSTSAGRSRAAGATSTSTLTWTGATSTSNSAGPCSGPRVRF